MTLPAVFGAIVGQPRAVPALAASAARPVHAHLLVGETGWGTRRAALAFAAALLCDERGCGDCRDCRLVLGERHPDVVVVEREGASIAKAQIDQVLDEANTSPVDGARKVLVLVDFHLVDTQYPRLLKTLEEPPPSTLFVVLAERVPPELAPIASRCNVVEFAPIAADVIAEVLVEETACSPEQAQAAAEAARGSLERARLLVDDPGFAARHDQWRQVPGALDGRGATIAEVADELLGGIEPLLAILRARHAEERAELDRVLERDKPRDARGQLRRLEERHRREERRLRTDELRAGLATLAGAYRDRAVGSVGSPSARATAAVDLIDSRAKELVRNPNEALFLQGVLVHLTELAET